MFRLILIFYFLLIINTSLYVKYFGRLYCPCFVSQTILKRSKNLCKILNPSNSIGIYTRAITENVTHHLSECNGSALFQICSPPPSSLKMMQCSKVSKSFVSGILLLRVGSIKSHQNAPNELKVCLPCVSENSAVYQCIF